MWDRHGGRPLANFGNLYTTPFVLVHILYVTSTLTTTSTWRDIIFAVVALMHAQLGQERF